MTTKHRLPVRPPHVAGIQSTSKMLTCPVCKRQVAVGGPIAGEWVVQAHSPQPGGIVMCAGFDQRVKVE